MYRDPRYVYIRKPVYVFAVVCASFAAVVQALTLMVLLHYIAFGTPV